MTSKKRLLKYKLDIDIKKSVFVFLVFLVGCTTKIIKDDAPAPIENGQNRVETVVCGHYAVGNNMCWVGPGEPANAVELTVITYFDGRLVLKSSGAGCLIDDSITVKGFGPKRINLSKYFASFGRSCILDVIYQPEFPGEENSDAKIRGAAGRVAIMVGDLERALLSVDNSGPYVRDDDLFYEGSGLISVRQANSYSGGKSFRISTGRSRSGTIRIDGCGLEALIFSYASENPVLGFDKLIRGKIASVDNCVFVGRIVPRDTDEDLSFGLVLEVFSRKTILLQEPELEVSSRRVKFSTTGPVSWTFVDDQSFNEKSGSADIEKGSFILRQVTAVGRTRIVKYENGYEVWSR